MAIVVTGAAGLSAQAHRQQTALLLPPLAAGALQTRGGVHSGLSITKTTGMGFQIEPGRAAVPGATPADGTFAVTVIDATAGTFDPGDSTRNRIDIVALKVDPTLSETGAGSIVIVKGDYPSSGNPVPPVVPDGQLALWQVPINAGFSAGNGGWDTTKKVDLRKQIAAVGGNPIVASQAERDLLAPYEGLRVIRADLDNAVDNYTKGTWRLRGVIRHAEYTAGGTVDFPAKSKWGPGVFKVDPNPTRNNDFSQPGTNDVIQILREGWYRLEAWFSGLNACPSGEMLIGTYMADSIGGVSWGATRSTVAYIPGVTNVFFQVNNLATSWSKPACRVRITKLDD